MLIDHGGAWRVAEVGEAHSFMERTVLVFVEFNTPFSKFSNRPSDTSVNSNPRKNFPECKISSVSNYPTLSAFVLNLPC